MTDAQRLFLVRGAHTVIYFLMASAVFAVLFASIVGARDWWVWAALVLVAIEVAVFTGSGMKCPMTNLAARYGGGAGGDTFLPESLTRHTLAFFGPLIAIGVVLMIARWWGFLA